ncbi:MAG: COG3014 family protein [Opitutales bacterium]
MMVCPPLLRALLAAAVASLFGGCASYNDQTLNVDMAYASGDVTRAATAAAANAKRQDNSASAVLFHLENGLAQRYQAAFEPSLAAFEQAEARVDEFDAGARLRLGRETGALLTNQAQLPYTGRDYDRVMMNTYKALNFIALGNHEAARVELNRALQRQRDALDANARRLERAREDAAQARSGQIAGSGGQRYDVTRAKETPTVASAMDLATAGLDTRMRAYAAYVNPFSVFLDGLFFLHTAYDASDLERARLSFERVASMSPGDAIHADLARAEAAVQGEPLPPMTYVIFETGFAPRRAEVRFDLPLFHTRGVTYVGAAFPQLTFRDRFVNVLQVEAGDTLHGTELVADMDAVVAQEFQNEWPAVVTKTLTSTALKALADYALNKAMEDESWQAQLAVRLTTALAAASTVGADLRTWKALPKQFQYTSFPTPADRTLQLTAGLQNAEVTLADGQVNLIFVRSFSPQTSLFIDQFVLP